MRSAVPSCILALSLTATLAAAESAVLVDYDFDGEAVATGPYTLMVFENSRGSVSLTESFRNSGRRSVEIRDVAGDGEFAELQGYFDDPGTGRVFVHFAFMSAEPKESFNIALAGPAHFILEPGGIRRVHYQ